MTKKIEGYQAYAINWTESEQGFGPRNDGYSLHLTKEDAKLFKEKWGVEGTEYEYSYAEWLIFMVIVSEEIYKLLEEAAAADRPGKRFYHPKRLEPGQVVEISPYSN